VPPTTSAFRFRDIAVAAYGPSFVIAIGYGAVTPVIALRARELGADVGTAALLVALLSVGPLLAGLPAGAIVARVGERRTLVVTGVLDAGAMLAGAAAHSVVVLGAAVAVSGALWTAFLQARQGYMIDAVPHAYRARAMAALGGSMRLGILVGPLLGAGLIRLWGTHSAFLLAATTSLAAGLLALSVPDLSAPDRATSARPLSVWRVLHDHRATLLTVGIAVVVIGATRTARTALLPLWAEHVGLSASTTSLIFGLAAGVDLACFYPGGWLTDRYGRALTAVCVTAATATGVLLLPLAGSALGLAAVAALMAVGNGFGSGIVMTLGADHAPVVGRAQFLGAWRLCGDLGGTTGPLVISVVVAVAPLAMACLVVGGLGWLGTGWVGYWVRRVTAPSP